MRVLGVHVSEAGTEWCRLIGDDCAGGVYDGDGLRAVIDDVICRGLAGSDADPLIIVIGGDVQPNHKTDLLQLEDTTPGVEVAIYSKWDTGAAIRAASRATWSVAKTMRARGLLGPEAPTGRAAALTLDMAGRI